MYTNKDYRTKKELKADCARFVELKARNGTLTPEEEVERNRLAGRLEVYQPNGDITNTPNPKQGRVYLEGPHYPQPHKWYAQGEVEDGVLVKVR